MFAQPPEVNSTPDALPEGHAAPDMAATSVDIGMQLDRVLVAFLTKKANSVQELQKLDELYKEAGSLTNTFVETTARRLFQQSDVLTDFNFQSSLLAGGSSFFAAVIRRMGELTDKEPELAEMAKLPVLIRLVEHHRRGRNENQMRAFAERVTNELRERVAENDTLALGQQGKVAYELSMHAFNEGDYEQAIAIAEESISLCERAGDLYGVLQARGNVAGSFRYTWAKSLGAGDPKYATLINEGRPVLEEDLQTTQAQIAEDTPDRKNFDRVESNNAMHLMKIAGLQGDLALARQMMAVLRANPIYLSTTTIAKDGATAVKGDVFTEILAKLEQAEAEKSGQAS